MRTPASSSFAWWNCCAAAQAQLFAFAGTKSRTRTPRLAARFDPPDHPAIGDVRIDDVKRLSSAVEQPPDRVGDRAVGTGRVVQHDRGHGIGAAVELREEGIELGCPDVPPEPAEGGDEHQLQLGDDRAGNAYEQIVEAPVLEVILDPGAAHPADAAVDDRHLAMVDVPELAKVPARVSRAAERTGRRACLHRAHDADLDPGAQETVVERSRSTLGVGAAPVDDEPDPHALGGLRDQRVGKTVSHDSGAEAELVDVHRGRRGGDVLEQPRVEVVALDENLGGRGRAFDEREREIGEPDLPAHQPGCVRAQLFVRDRARQAGSRHWTPSSTGPRR